MTVRTLPFLWLALALALTACRSHADGVSEPEDPPVATRCVPALRATLVETRSIRGTVASAPDHQAVVSAQVAGRITRVRVREADAVRAGDIVAVVESATLQDALTQARAAEAQARAGARNAGTSLTRIEYLFGRGIVARQEVDDARTRRDQADGAVAQAHAMTETAARNVSRAELRAPLTGVVVRVIRQAGEVVDGTPATPVLEIADPTDLELQGAAPPADLVALRAGQTARVRFDALPGRVLMATVRAVSPSVAVNTGVGVVRLALDTHEGTVPLGLYGTADVSTGEHPDATVVPSEAIRNSGTSGSEVVVCDNGHARSRAVTVGLREGSQIEVTSGVTPGTLVAIDNVLGLTDGTAITARPDTDGGTQ